MKKNIIFAALIVLGVVFALFFLAKKPSPMISQSEGLHAYFSCDKGKTIDATFYIGETKVPVNEGEPPVPGGSVKILLSDGRAMTLGQSISADGARYANTDESFVFWDKGNGALVLEDNVEKSYMGCIVVAPQPENSNLTRVYSSGSNGFSLRTPEAYTIDAAYRYELAPKKVFGGVKFIIPAPVADGTNLGHDSYLSVESSPRTENCNANLFVDQGELTQPAKELTENGTTYSVASTTGAGLGNRYEETVYAIPGTNPCRAVRYFVHYSIIENYPPGMVRAFDKKALLNEFDLIRSTLTLN